MKTKQKKTKAKVNLQHIWVTAINPFIVKGRTKETVVEEGTYFEVKSVSVDNKGGIILEPVNSETPGFKFRASPHEVRVYVGHVPDYRLDMSFVEFGYQADHYKRASQDEKDERHTFLQPTHTTCRDFGGSYPIEKLVERIQTFAEKMILKFKEKL